MRSAILVVLGTLPMTPALADDAADLGALLARGDARTALARAEVAMATQPRDAALRFLRGVALMDLLRDGEALEQFEFLCQEHPALPDPWNNVALLQVRAGRLEAARVALENALRADPSHRTARWNLGLVHVMLAVQSWEHVAASGPVDPSQVRQLQSARALLAGVAR